MPCPFATTVFLLYGGIGDAVALTATAPLERIVLILQTEPDNKKRTENGIIATYHRIVQNQGFTSLWLGNTTRILQAILSRPLSEYLQKKIQHLLLKDDEGEKKDRELNDQELQNVYRTKQISELLGVVVPLLILYPLEVAVVHISSDTTSDNTKSSSKSVQECCKSIIKTSGGLSGLFNGVGYAIIGAIQFRYSYFWLYKKFQISQIQSTERQFWANQLIVILAGIAAQPYQILQRNVILSQSTSTLSLHLLFAGTGANVLKIVTNGAVTTVYSHLARKYRFG